MIKKSELVPTEADLTLDVNREMLIQAQQNDPSLTTCFSSAVATEESRPHIGYFIENRVLMRRWATDSEDLTSASTKGIQTSGTRSRT